MIDLGWPEEGNSLNMPTPEDAKKLAMILNGLYSEYEMMHLRLTKVNQELEGMWAHIRNLEEKLLHPEEVLEIHSHDEFGKGKTAIETTGGKLPAC